jgi:hypothetical protein
MIAAAYEKLVTHLQIALRSIKDDESNFKDCIDRERAEPKSGEPGGPGKRRDPCRERPHRRWERALRGLPRISEARPAPRPYRLR